MRFGSDVILLKFFQSTSERNSLSFLYENFISNCIALYYETLVADPKCAGIRNRSSHTFF